MSGPSPSRSWAPRTAPSVEAADIEQARAFWRRVECYAAGEEVRRHTVASTPIVVSGWGCEVRVLPNGRRQIFSILLPGDRLYLPSEACPSGVSILALTRLEVADAGGLDTVGPRAADPSRMTEALLRQSDRLFDHIVRLGALSANARTIHLLLELHERLTAIQLVKSDTFRMPLTQETFGEILGLSVVHINRTLGDLRRRGLITLRSGSVTLHDLEQLAELGAYTPKLMS